MNDFEIATLFENSEDCFDKMISDMQVYLIKCDEKYREVDAINRKLRSKNSKISDAFESDKYTDLDAEDVKTLIEIIDNNQLLKNIELKKMFMLGNKEAYYYFNRIGIIKTEDTK